MGASGGTGGVGGTGGGAAPKCTNLTDFPLGVAAGDVDQSSVVLWARPQFEGTVRFEYGTDPDFVQTPKGVSVSVTGPIASKYGEMYIPAKAEITGLLDGTQYYYRACRDSPGALCPTAVGGGCKAPASFRTPHAVADGHKGLRFGVSSCFRGDMRPFVSIKNVPDRNLDAFVALGDTVYADSPLTCGAGAAILEDFRCKHEQAYQKRYSQQDENMLARARASTAFFVDIDDHEVDDNFAGGWCNLSGDNCTNDTKLFDDGLRAFVEYNPIRGERYPPSTHAEDKRWEGERKLYRYRKFGKDAALFMLDARSFRDRNAYPLRWSAGRTMLGAAQLEELKEDLGDAENNGIIWKFVLLPEPIQNLENSPSRGDRFEGYAYERGQILHFIESECMANVVFISGDIHGTVTNNLVYKLSSSDPQRYSATWDISTGPVAYGCPDCGIAADDQINGLYGDSIVKLTNVPGGITAYPWDDYNALAPEEQNKKIKELMDDMLDGLGYPLTGLDPEPPEGRRDPSKANIPAFFPKHDAPENTYVATNTFGWTEFEIDATTHNLTVTTYGIDPYKEHARGGVYTDKQVADLLDRQQRIVSQFEVEPISVGAGGSCP
jgi:phosphodiesterase/alkaline phosphatase D-like protein